MRKYKLDAERGEAINNTARLNLISNTIILL